MWRKSLEDWLSTTSLSGFNQLYIEQLYEQYSLDPNSVEEKWAELFRDLESGSLITKSRYADSLSQHEPVAGSALVSAYRNFGHLIANIDPLNRWQRNQSIPFNLIDYNLHPDQDIKLYEPVFGEKKYNVADLYTKLRETYTKSIGFEFGHISNQAIRDWLIKHIEATQEEVNYVEKVRVLNRLVRAEQLEIVLANKFPGAKRFSLEGNESFIILLDKIYELAADNDYRDLYLSMAHRGRLNALVNNFDLNTQELFALFAGNAPLDDTLFSSDVKYHSGRSLSFRKTTPYNQKQNKLTDTKAQDSFNVHLCYNPSHLEVVGAVCLGATRAKQTQYYQELKIKEFSTRGNFGNSKATDLVLPVIVHGDSAMSGQGIVQEMFNLSRTRGYSVGGAIHVVINNQIGFTTSNHKDMRSSIYATDIAKMVEAPIIHVNADDPIAVLKATTLAFKYRQRFKQDVVIDLIGYRRLGHNEADDPSVTQPVMYKGVKQKELISTLYARQLVAQSVIEEGYLEEIRKAIYFQLLNGDYKLEIANLVADHIIADQADFTKAEMTPKGRAYELPDTNLVSESELQQLALELVDIPDNVEMAATTKRFYDNRYKIFTEKLPMNWGEAELLAYTTLLRSGKDIRLSGEDSGRGTFFHRLAVVHNGLKTQEVVPMQEIAKRYERKFEVWDSTLSETGVLGFEYGYSISSPNTLVLWEAQFGDFANVAQPVIDQFISSGETKWNQVSGLTLLLPHGYEGQGPEHSSARIERYLQLCANNNMRVVVPTSAKAIYHLLLEQGLSENKKPLVVFTPKSLLRLPQAQTTFKQLVSEKFTPVEYDQADLAQRASQIEKLVISTGRIRYDVANNISEQGLDKVFQLQVEQLYPFPTAEIKAVIDALPNLKLVEWTQDEPENQGSWNFAFPQLLKLRFAGNYQFHLNSNTRPASATTACGYGKAHKRELEAILAQVGQSDKFII